MLVSRDSNNMIIDQPYCSNVFSAGSHKLAIEKDVCLVEQHAKNASVLATATHKQSDAYYCIYQQTTDQYGISK